MTVLNSHTSDTAMATVEANASNNVKVIVRVRPPNDVELSEQRKNVIEIMNENILVFDPREQSSPFHGRRRHRDIRKRRQKDLKFAFDHVFGWASSNVEVFEHSTRTVLDGLLGGYNCSVFAYGATGAGKTHTMLGKESNPGVIYHTMIHLYRHISELSSEKTCDVAVSYLEVYNEQIRDLLMPHGTLPIREDHKTGVIVPGLSLHKPSSAEELLHMLHFGNQNRTQHPTDANAESSRSHAVFQVFVRQRERTANISAQVKVAKMCLVDLAGSERATLTKNRGARFREGANINRSLLALGNVINSLADHKYKGHIPYRDSKLTRLLKDSLGGNCRTIMIAAVSPSELTYEDTYNTLKYADRAKNIRLNMKKNVISVDFHVSQYKKVVEDLRSEISELKGKLHLSEKPSVNYAHSLCLPSNLQSLHEALQTAYNERRAVRDRQLHQEITMRDTQWRLYRKHKYLHRATQLAEAQSESVEKLQGVIEGLQRKVEEQEAQRQALHQQLHSNTQSLHTLHTEAAAEHNKSSLYSQVLENSIQRMGLEVEVNDSQHYIHHLRRLARAQEQETVASETLITALLQLVQHQHAQLQHHGALTPDLTASYRSVCELVGQWGVSWAHSDGDQHGFHINAIIDIPLITSNGVPHISRVAATSGLGCVATTGQSVPAHTPASLPASGPLPSLSYSRTPHRTLTAPSTPAGRLSFGASDPTKQESVATTTTDVSCSSHHPHPPPPPPDSNSYSVPGRFSHSPATTIHAGHTPNPKKLPHRTDWGRGPSTAFYAATDCVLPAAGGGGGGVGCVSTTTPGFPLSSPAPSLNETFSLDTIGVKHCVDKPMSTPAAVLKESVPLCLPVVDGERCVDNNAATTACTKGVSGENRNGSVQSHSRNPQHSLFSSVVPVMFTQPGTDTKLNGCMFTGVVVEDRQGAQEQDSECSVSPDNNQENEGSHQRPSSSSSSSFSSSSSSSSSARRAINFDGTSSAFTPVKMEVKSYADALRTPTPTRQPLRVLDCNSPQFQVSTLQNEEAQSSSVCAVSSQALDNMRRLRQLGLPSLVENLVTGHKNGCGPEGSRAPRYMQATKATARRVRLQPMSKDDCFHPRRVPGSKSLAHSRSKSTSQLNKVGWKI